MNIKLNVIKKILGGQAPLSSALKVRFRLKMTLSVLTVIVLVPPLIQEEFVHTVILKGKLKMNHYTKISSKKLR